MNKPSRRAVVRTGVWAVPVVATAVAVPAAFAGSGTPPVIVSGKGNVGKDPGEGQNTKDYEFTIFFTNETSDPQTVNIANFNFKDRDNVPNPASVVVPANATNFPFVIKVLNFDDSSSNPLATISYTVTSSGSTVYSASISFDTPIHPCKS